MKSSYLSPVAERKIETESSPKNESIQQFHDINQLRYKISPINNKNLSEEINLPSIRNERSMMNSTGL